MIVSSSLGKMREKDSAVVMPNNEDLVLICAYYFAVWAAQNLHAMRWNQLRFSHRQSDSPIKGLIKRKKEKEEAAAAAASYSPREMWMSQHSNLLTHTSKPSDTGRKNKGSNIKMFPNFLFFDVAPIRTLIPVESGKGRRWRSTLSHKAFLLQNCPLPPIFF